MPNSDPEALFLKLLGFLIDLGEHSAGTGHPAAVAARAILAELQAKPE